MKKNLAIIATALAVIALPFLVRALSPQNALPHASQKIVIISPHNETIRYEFSRAFAHYMKKKTGEAVGIDWRAPGGTSEIAKFINSSFLAAFEHHWSGQLGKPWSAEIASNFNNRKFPIDDSPGDDTPAEAARRYFLQSDVGVGIDLFFGGGTYDFQVQAKAGHLVDSGIRQKRAEWFDDTIIPATFSGETYYDPQGSWVGTCLSSFGFCYNVDSLRDLAIAPEPEQWSDLGQPSFFGQIALADPSKSGSATKAFEMLIQEQIQLAIESANLSSVRSKKKRAELEALAIREGWQKGLQLIQRISANARYFTDSASKIPLDVSGGNAAAGMCIDFYGRVQSETVRTDDGSSRVQYHTPASGSSTSVDPIGMLRGAPHPELALAFIEFVLSPEGQKLWNYRVGAPGGPTKKALRRLPIRRDIYTSENLAHFSDADVLPYTRGASFVYHPEWTAPLFNSIRFIIRTMCLETHHEQREAWEALIAADFPPRATARFFDVSAAHYDTASQRISQVLRARDKLAEIALAKELTATFRENYRQARELAEQESQRAVALD